MCKIQGKFTSDYFIYLNCIWELLIIPCVVSYVISHRSRDVRVKKQLKAFTIPFLQLLFHYILKLDTLFMASAFLLSTIFDTLIDEIHGK